MAAGIPDRQLDRWRPTGPVPRPGSRRSPLGPILACLLACTPAHAAEVTLHGSDLFQVGSLGWVAPRLTLPVPDPSLPLVSPKQKDPGADFLRQLGNRGLASGFSGILYDNRDRGHSVLPGDTFPQLARLTYAPDLRARDLDYGLGGAILYPVIVLGNSSTAIRGGPIARSLPRLAMTAEGGAAIAFRSYVSNQIYVYPEHRDHDAVDLFPANWPYMVISQGSSRSDRPFLRAIAMTLAALPADTRKRLQETGLIAPTLQMILRRSQKQVPSREAYFTGAAHPTVFRADQLQPERMIGLAAALRPETIPPLVRLTVEEEDFAPFAGLAGLSERLFTTPSAIARIWRAPDWERGMILSAAETHDPNDRPLQFRWAVLRGDPTRVKIEPLDATASRARITLNWHDPRVLAIPPDASRAPTADDEEEEDTGKRPTEMQTSRVDIGVFASNGAQDSAPALLSISFPTHEARHYGPGPDGTIRLLSVDYDALGRKAAYDPALHWSAPWTDTAVLGPDGTPTGWRRQTADGSLLLDLAGQPAEGSPLVYQVDRAKPARPILRADPPGAEIEN